VHTRQHDDDFVAGVRSLADQRRITAGLAELNSTSNLTTKSEVILIFLLTYATFISEK
jgi:hypothetical protein